MSPTSQRPRAMSDQSPHCDDLENELTRQRRKAQRYRVEDACDLLGPRALEILADIAERLAKGAKQYGGDFDDKPRQWHEEQYEELADALVYGAMAQIQRREQARADAERAAAANRGPVKAAELSCLATAKAFAEDYGPATERDAAWPAE